jgi:hypothetical protein
VTGELKKLREVIRRLHGVDSSPLRSEPVHETFQGKTVWEGVVEVFAVYGHPKASAAYAWGFENDAGNREYVAVLGVPPVNSPRDAVRAYVAATISSQAT